jgi:hypothetical protein
MLEARATLEHLPCMHVVVPAVAATDDQRVDGNGDSEGHALEDEGRL